MATTTLEERLCDLAGVTEVVVAEEVDSTNLVARRRVDEGSRAGLVVVAERQTAGRGRRGRTWDDVAGGNVAIGTVVEMPEAASLLPLAAALALAEVFDRLGLDVSLKWPNDVRVRVAGVARKCAGILVESLGPGRPPLAVVGIGIDVDWRDVTRAGETRDWTSLAEATGSDVDRDDLVVAVLVALRRRVVELASGPGPVRAAYRRACDTLGEQVRVDLGSRVVTGRASGIADDGSLVLETADGPLSVAAGDVVHLREA